MAKSSEFMEGFRACASGIIRFRNPYRTATDVPIQSYLDWTEGWNTRFYGESIIQEQGLQDP